MKLLTWTLKRPSDSTFTTFADIVEGEPWYSPNWQIKDPNAMKNWNAGNRSFMEMLEKHTDKFYAIGTHEMEVNTDGTILDMAKSGYTGYRTDPKFWVLNDDLSDLREGNYLMKCLRYSMHRYPNIKWGLQFLATMNSTGDRVSPLLDNANGELDTFILHCRKICEQYIKYFPMIKTVEIDFEKTSTRDSVNGVHESELQRDAFVRIKNEVCIPLGLELRVNLVPLTAPFTPQYYSYQDYGTMAEGVDKNGNMAIDEYQLMTYEFSWSGSAPGASTPLWWLKQVLEYIKDVLPMDRVFIGNAGYGRRWALGEWAWNDDGTPNVDTLRTGGALDYKQLMQVQNGMFIHNMGKTVNGQFRFFNQDFIPFCGFNDDESDYLKTFIHVYDRFNMTSNGGATFNGLNRPSGASYVTKYSTDQVGTFSGNITVCNSATTQGLVDTSTIRSYPISNGLDISSYTWTGHAITTIPENDSVTPPQITFNVKPPASGTYRVIALVNFPFYTSSDFTFTLNGVQKRVYIDEDWYPMTMIQKPHFYDCGTFDLASSNEAIITYTGGAHIYGFILCDNFEGSMVGGDVQIPATIYPMKRIANKDSKGNVEIVDAQFPSKLRIVGEILRRAPRPSIIWEDYFSSYTSDPTITVEATSFVYYKTTTGGGYSKGNWKIHSATTESSAYVANVRVANTHSQLMLNKPFSSNVYIEVKYKVTDSSAKYGVRIGASSDNSGYLVIADHSSQKFKIIKEVEGVQTELKSLAMSSSFFTGRTNSRTMKVTYVDGKISLFINSTCYIKEFDIGVVTGAIGAYVYNGTMNLYKFHIASLDRWERMERVKVEVEGNATPYYFGDVVRTCEEDKHGLLIFTGYPEDMRDTFPGRTIISTQVNTSYDWNADYRNMPIAVADAWQGKKNIKLTMIDAGIWLQTIFIGDAEGMSLAYNSDQVGFRKTVDFVGEYGCKGIGMWTLGQEDPMMYSYLH